MSGSGLAAGPWRASNGVLFLGVPGGIERVWWTFGAERRLAGGPRREIDAGLAQENLIAACREGWTAMDVALREGRHVYDATTE